MSFNRHVFRSLVLRSCAAMATLALLGSGATAQERVTVQQLFERGALDEAVQKAEGSNPESTFFAAQALVKMNNTAGASERYVHLRDTGDASWQAIGDSGAKLVAGDLEGAMQAAMRAVEANEGNAYAHYQVGAVASRQNNFDRAAEEFRRAVELKPDFAYAHYYAGLANQRIKNTAKMSEHFEAFLRLAPDAPERAAVSAVLRTLRG